MRAVWVGGLVGVVALAIAGCGTDRVYANAGCIPDPSGRLTRVDWSAAEVIDVRMRQDDFDPMVLGLLRDRPYVVRFSNGDDERHHFYAPDFFRTVALDSVAVNGAPQPQGCFTTVHIPAKGAAEIRFVALLDGRYGFDDSGLLDVDLGLGYETGEGFGMVQVR